MPAPTPVSPNGSSTALNGAASGTTSLVVNYPSGSVSGDYLVVEVITFRNATGTYTHTTPSGWTLLHNNNLSGASDAKNYSVFGRFRSSETSVTLAFSVAVFSAAAMIAYQGATVNPTPVNIITAAYDASGSATLTTPTATTTVGQTALVLLAQSVASGAAYTHTWTSPATEQADASIAMNAIGFSLGVTIGADVQATAAATSTRTATASTTALGRYTATLALAGIPPTASASTGVTATATATGQRTANVGVDTPTTATITAAVTRTANATTSTAVTAGLTASVARGHNTTVATQVAVGITAATAWDSTATTALVVTAGLTAVGFVGPVIDTNTAVTATTTAQAQRTTPAAATATVTTGVTAVASLAANITTSTTATVGLTGRLSTPAHVALEATAGLTAAAAVDRPIEALPTVVTVARSGRFATLIEGDTTHTIATTSAAAVRTAAGVKTVNGAQAITATLTATATRTRRGEANSTVTTTITATMHAEFRPGAPRIVTARLTAVARIEGQAEPDTPPERTLHIPPDDRLVPVSHENRTQVTPAEPRVLVPT